MALEGNKNYKGLFKNPDAIDARTKKWLAKLVGDVLEVAKEESLIPTLMVPNPLPRDHGTTGKFYDWGQLVARLKPDGLPTGQQKNKASSVSYELDEYEVKVPTTDRAKINSGMTAQDHLTAGKSGTAFARGIDAQGLEEFRDNVETAAAAGTWDIAADATILDEIATALDSLWNSGFTPDSIVMTQKQQSRIAKIGLTYATPLTAKELLQKQHESIKNIYIWRKITYIEEDDTEVVLFDPTGYWGVLASKACGVYTQRPITIEAWRDGEAGVDWAAMRKYFQTKVIQSKAGYVISGTGI